MKNALKGNPKKNAVKNTKPLSALQFLPYLTEIENHIKTIIQFQLLWGLLPKIDFHYLVSHENRI